MTTDLPTAALGSSQAPTAAVDKSPSASNTKIPTHPDGVYEIVAAVPFKRKDGQTALLDELVGHVIVQMLPFWLPKVRIDASNVWSLDGWFNDNFLPYKRPPMLGRWSAPTSPLWPSPDDVDDNDAV